MLHSACYSGRVAGTQVAEAVAKARTCLRALTESEL